MTIHQMGLEPQAEDVHTVEDDHLLMKYTVDNVGLKLK